MNSGLTNWIGSDTSSVSQASVKPGRWVGEPLHEEVSEHGVEVLAGLQVRTQLLLHIVTVSLARA